MPAPPTPTMWIVLRAARSMTGPPSGPGMGFNEIGDAVGGVGTRQALGGCCHEVEPVRIGEERVDFRDEPVAVEVRIRDDHRRAGVTDVAGVRVLMVGRHVGTRYE